MLHVLMLSKYVDGLMENYAKTFCLKNESISLLWCWETKFNVRIVMLGTIGLCVFAIKIPKKIEGNIPWIKKGILSYS